MRIFIKRVKAGDLILLAILIIIPIFLFFIRDSANSSDICIIRTPYSILGIKLPVDTVVVVKGFIGKSTIKIKADSVRMEYSPCKRKYCVKMGWIKKRNEEIICMPNGIIVKIGKEDIDGITQ